MELWKDLAFSACWIAVGLILWAVVLFSSASPHWLALTMTVWYTVVIPPLLVLGVWDGVRIRRKRSP